MTVDVQKNRFYSVVREWFDGGDSALVEFAEVQAWKELAGIRAKYNVHQVGIDMGYTERRIETLDEIFTGNLRGAVAMFGRDSLKEPVKIDKEYDPYEGTAKQSRRRMYAVTFNPNIHKHALSQLMNGSDPHQWILPTDIALEYVLQVTAEECIDGAWIAKRKDNHALDCETMQLTLATVTGVFRQLAIDLDVSAAEITTPYAAPKARKVGIYVPD